MAFALKKQRLTRGILLTRCASCGRRGVPMEIGGKGKKKILIVFEQPTEKQYEKDSWFGSNTMVYSALRECGIIPEEDCCVTGVYRCSKDSAKPKVQNNNVSVTHNKQETDKKVSVTGKKSKYEDCVCGVRDAIKQINPVMIISVGSLATGAVLRLYNGSHFGLGRSYGQYVGRTIPLKDKNILGNETAVDSGLFDCWLVPVASDEDINNYRNPKQQDVAYKWLKKHIAYAYEKFKCGKDNLPLDEVRPKLFNFPEPKLLYNTKEIKSAIQEACESDYTAFDYETNCLQPEESYKNHYLSNPRQRKLYPEVICVSLAYGDSNGMKKAVAFQMSKDISEDWKRFLDSKTRKIVANVKFEERWSRVIYKRPINNFYWDVCIGGRVMECISGMSGLKYLTFVYFGVIGYDDDVSAHIEDDENGFNNLRTKVSISNLLMYNCLDSIYTYALAIIQHKELGIEWAK